MFKSSGYLPNPYRRRTNESLPKHYLNNAVVINTRCVQVFRSRLGRERLTDQEYDLCDALGDELARLLPHDYKISKLEAIPPERIVEWAEQKAKHEEMTIADLYEMDRHEMNDNIRFSLSEKLFLFGCLGGIILIFIAALLA